MHDASSDLAAVSIVSLEFLKGEEAMGELKEIIFLIKESEEGGYEARALDHSIYTQAEDLESLRKAIKDAIKCHFNEGERPQIIRLHIVRDEVLAL